MRISDWSSDVCSSDLRAVRLAGDDFRALLDFRGERHGDEAVGGDDRGQVTGSGQVAAHVERDNPDALPEYRDEALGHGSVLRGEVRPSSQRRTSAPRLSAWTSYPRDRKRTRLNSSH